MSVQVTNQNNVKIYTVASSSKSAIPEWLAKSRKKDLRHDQSWNQRIELIQDFGFPEASIKLKSTRDEKFILATGTYKPQIRVFELEEASMKFDRHTEAENVQFEILSDDWTKFVMLQADRTIEFHNNMGLYYKTRIPKFGRDMKYNFNSCDLVIASSSTDIYRLNLEQGRFLRPFETDSEGNNTVAINEASNVIAVGGQDGYIEFWDPRSKVRLGRFMVPGTGIESNEITAFAFAQDGLKYSVGNAAGIVSLFDLRSSSVLLKKDHQYGLPIRKIDFHSSGNVVSADVKSIKIWNKDSGDLFTSFEPESDINDFLIFKDTGLLTTANEGPNMNIFFCPSLGPAPKWCSFLDNLTEELQEKPNNNTWDDYKFVTTKELSKLGLDHLIGSSVLKAYMHGYFVDIRLYDKARAVSNPFEYQEYRQKLVLQKLEDEQKSRICASRKLPKINRLVAEQMIMKAEKKAAKSDAHLKIDAEDPLGDKRFSEMFANPEFEVDTNDPEFMKFHAPIPSEKSNEVRRYTDENVHEVNEIEGKNSDEDTSSDEDEDMITKKVSHSFKEKQKARNSRKNRNISELTIKPTRSKGTKKCTFGERLLNAQEESSYKAIRLNRGTHGALSMKFKPKRGKVVRRSKR